MVLDTNSRLHLSWHLRSRRAQLSQGRANFNITPTIYRPFIAKAQPATVRVLGTTFDISRIDRQHIQVRLYKGVVHVMLDSVHAHKAASHRLAPGTTLDINGGAVSMRHTDIPTQTASWTQGQLIFEGMPLGQALAEIQRYNTVPIVLQNKELAQLRVSGVFQITQLDRIFDLLPLVWPIQVLHEGPTILIRQATTAQR